MVRILKQLYLYLMIMLDLKKLLVKLLDIIVVRAVQQWYVTVTGTFSYGNGSAKCISSSVKSGVYNNKWAISSKSASKSGATAIASATAKHSYDNTAYETKKLTVRLTCSSTGVLS